MQWASTRLIWFCCRLILANNRILYPYHKWMMGCVKTAPEKPQGLLELIETCCTGPLPINATNRPPWCRGSAPGRSLP